MIGKRQHVITLRRKGKTYGEIAKTLKLPKSTVAWQLKNLRISKSLQKKILERSRKKWRRNIATYNKFYGKVRSREAARIRDRHKEKAAKDIKSLSRKDIKLIGAALYWAEGGTKNRNSLHFGNSNPLIIKTIMRFFREVCNISNGKIKARIHLYPGINQRRATNYWKKVIRLPQKNFHKPQVQISRASKKKRPRNTLPYGTLHLTVNNTELTCKVKGWIQGISEKI